MRSRLRALLQDTGGDGTTAEAVYRALRHGIVHGDLAPGERLRSDALANELRVSRTPVREALAQARSRRPRRALGLRVSSCARFSEQDLTELFYVREALEGMAARLAAENATPSEIAQIRDLLDDMESVQPRRRSSMRCAGSPASFISWCAAPRTTIACCNR